MTDSSSCARSSPARPQLGLFVRSLSIRRLRRRYPVSCALPVSNGVLPRLRPRAFLARCLRRPPGEDGRLELLRHGATPIRGGCRQLSIFGAASRASYEVPSAVAVNNSLIVMNCRARSTIFAGLSRRSLSSPGTSSSFSFRSCSMRASCAAISSGVKHSSHFGNKSR